jgi:hypothetical protein
MKDSKTINSLSHFIEITTQLNFNSKSYRSISVSSMNFYRGQADASWVLEPKLYRENLFQKEGALISELLRVAPNEFKDRHYFDNLVKMQHYGLPTRLLDTTLNPLVALFFACYGEHQQDADGSVYCFPQQPVFMQDNSFISLVLKYIFEYSEFPLDIANFRENVINDNDIHSAHTMKIKTDEDILHILKNFGHMAVVPKLNNPRILLQDGAFFLFGMKIKNERISNNAGTLGKRHYQFEKIKFTNETDKFGRGFRILTVPAKYKTRILDELSSVGISSNRLFPELEHQTAFVTNKIRNEII